MISFALQYPLPGMFGSLILPFGDERHLNSQMGNPMRYFLGKLKIMESSNSNLNLFSSITGRNLGTRQGQEKRTQSPFSRHTPAFRLGKVPQWLEWKLQPNEPREKEILVPDVKVGEIEEEGGIQRYRVSQSILGPYAKGNEETDVVLISP